jgi:glutamate-1-semialdehyde aminotransferase
LTSDAQLYVGFHRAMIERGFLMMPANLKRNSLTAAHSDEDIARMLQAAEDVLGGFARARIRPDSRRGLEATIPVGEVSA